MAYTFRVGNNDYINSLFDFFVESKPGFYNQYVRGQSSYVTHESGSNVFIACVDNGTYGIPLCLQIFQVHNGPSYYTTTSIIELLDGTSDWIYATSGYISNLGTRVTIVDSHGTHVGSQNCNGSRFGASYEGLVNPSCVGVMHTSTDDGYVFKGWKVKYTGNLSLLSTGYEEIEEEGSLSYYYSGDYDAAIIVKLSSSNSSTLYIEAVYEVKKDAGVISFDLNGGTPEIESITEEVGSTINLPNIIPKKDGFIFLYWESKTTGGHYNPNQEYTIVGDDKFVAIWKYNPTPSKKKIKNQNRGRLLYYKSGELIYSTNGSLVF